MPKTLKTLSIAAIPAFIACAVPAFADMPATKPLHMKKECSGYTNPAPTFCSVTESNLPDIAKGTKIWYWGPDLGLDDPVMVASTAIIDAGQNNLAQGFCIVDQTDMDHQKGYCAFSAGTGTLAGFHALITVTAAMTGDVNWDGLWWTTK